MMFDQRSDRRPVPRDDDGGSLWWRHDYARLVIMAQVSVQAGEELELVRDDGDGWIEARLKMMWHIRITSLSNEE